jgi:hypothetical protein
MLVQKTGVLGGFSGDDGGLLDPLIWGVFHNIGPVFANKGVFSIMFSYFECNMGPNKARLFGPCLAY